MPETGQSWQRAFPPEAAQAAEARAWVSTHTGHTDAPQITAELFIAVLAVHPSKVQMTVSTAGIRLRITASGDRMLSLQALYGPGRVIITELSTAQGTAVDGRGLWAELGSEQP
ncbi:hypothetical protein [Actinacidiphila sp. ITFR-21]|uniref:hypothetical protein n=1 Tax=Actinacidiphila sp. ITFR-21 TaxID=3075199 RepID=UPI002889F67D|nr:hypothetical protein [Streptomyces sp. ITFR-21]WNI16894.1 hypothetical protein RLT57_16120 [Streptomyces sp. ITFR-21]